MSEDDGRLPYGWSNGVWRVENEAVKRYAGVAATTKCRREASVLKALEDRLSVPHIIEVAPDQIRMEFVDGMNGQPALEGSTEEEGRQLFLLAGELLRSVHGVPMDELPDLPGSGSVLVHGDFAAYNLICSEDRSEIRALVDWERAKRGEPIEDISWFEWTVRKWWRPRVPALRDFFGGYGDRPEWPRRRAWMVQCIDDHIERVRPEAPHLIPKWEGFRDEIDAFAPLEDD